jgi:hypothetical protein
MQRRELLQGLAAISLASVVTQIGCSRPKMKMQKDSQGRLNIVLHGMFAVGLDLRNPLKKRAWLLAPKVRDHLYAVGTADVTATSDIQWLWEARVEAGQQSQIVIPTRDPALGKLPTQLDWLLGWKKSRIDHLKGNEHWNIALPMPDDVWGLRAYSGNPFDTRGNTYQWNSLAVSQVPTVLVLTYYPVDLTAANVPLFKDVTPGTTQPPIPIPFSANDNVARLHLFAESPFDLPNPDPNMALTEFNKLFGDSSDNTILDLSIKSGFSSSDVPVDSAIPTNDPGVMVCEERNLGELDIPCDFLPQLSSTPKPNAATKVHNCMSVVIDAAS